MVKIWETEGDLPTNRPLFPLCIGAASFAAGMHKPYAPVSRQPLAADER